jgi:glutamate formiminotransferase
MTALFEIVPNISEGRNHEIVDAAIEAVAATGARLLHRTSDRAHHRSVLTLAGDGDSVVAAAIALAGFAVDRIDLRTHRGVHPRIGALDVLPFVPLGDATLADAAALAHRAGAEIWRRWSIPSFYYGAAARAPGRAVLADVRRGEFEGLDERFSDPAWMPDEGDIPKHPTAGAIAIGARDLLIAFNVDLETGDLALARSIAARLRERDGGLRSLRTLGLRLAPDRVQVSLNITAYEATPLARVVETIRLLAGAAGVKIARSELIGLLPRAALEAAAAYYLGVPLDAQPSGVSKAF